MATKSVHSSLKSNLKKIAHDAEKKAEQLVERTALLAESKTKENLVEMAAVDTGNLLNSYHSAKLAPLLWVVGTMVEYAPAIEYGTSKMPARPALTNALADPQLTKNFQKTLAALLKK